MFQTGTLESFRYRCLFFLHNPLDFFFQRLRRCQVGEDVFLRKKRWLGVVISKDGDSFHLYVVGTFFCQGFLKDRFRLLKGPYRIFYNEA